MSLSREEQEKPRRRGAAARTAPRPRLPAAAPALVLLAGLLSCGLLSNPAVDRSVYTVSYEVSGTAAAVDVSLLEPGGGTQNLPAVPLPWTLSLEGAVDYASPDLVSLSASWTAGAAGESVTAAIYYTVSVKKRLIASAVTAPASMPEKVEVFYLLPPD